MPSDERADLIDHILWLDHRLIHLIQSGQPYAWLTIDLTMPQLKVLLIVFASGSAMASQLARSLGVGLPTITGLVDRLREHGLVTRSEDPQDRRVTRITLTGSGQALVDRLQRAGRERFGRLLVQLDLTALHTVAQALDYLYRAALADAETSGVGPPTVAPALAGRAG